MSATLTTIGSGSSANGYILTCGENKLILEAGCKPKDYLKALDYDITTVVGICVTHWHSDHSRSIKALQHYGLKVYSSADVAALNTNVEILRPMQRYTIGGFKVLPLEVPHGDCPNYAYHITMPDGQTLLFATDLERFPYSVKGVTHLMLECNYSSELIIDSLVNGDILRSQSQNHMEIEECISTAKRLRHGGLQSVILIHLSNGLSDINMFKERFRSELGITPLIAEPKLIVELNKEDF